MVFGEGELGMGMKFTDIAGTVVGEAVTFRMGPQRFDGVQIGRVGRQMFEGHIAAPRCPAFDQQRAMRLKIVEQHDHGAADVTPDLLQKLQHLAAANRFFRVQADVGGKSPPFGRDGDRSDRRNLARVAGPMNELRRLADGRPGPPHVRCQQQAAFIDEDKVRLLATRLFLIRGQSRATQPSTAAWFRSRARRCGFWQLNPRSRSKSVR
jgi:hypothetical protein